MLCQHQVWELAVYLKLCDNPEVKFVSIQKHIIQTAVSAIAIFLYALAQIALALAEGQSNQSTVKEIVDWCELVAFFIISQLIFIFGQKHFRAMDHMREVIESYDCRKAKLAVPEDRAVLLGFVNNLFKSEDPRRSSLTQSSRANSQHSGRPSTVPSTISNPVSTFSDSASNPASPKSTIMSPSSRASPASASSRRTGRRRSLDNYDGIDDDDQEAGILRFNRAVQQRVPDQLPMRGLKSWKVMSYQAAVISLSSRHIFTNLDVLAYEGFSLTFAYTTAGIAGGATDTSSEEWRAILCIIWTSLVQYPFTIYLLGVTVKLFLIAQEYTMAKTGISYKMSVLIYAPLWVVWDVVLYWKGVWDLNVSQSLYIAMGTQPGAKPRLVWSWFYGLQRILDFYKKLDPEEDGTGDLKYIWQINNPTSFYVLFWMFVFTPITILCYLVYEPVWGRNVRWWLYVFFCKFRTDKVKKSKHFPI